MFPRGLFSHLTTSDRPNNLENLLVAKARPVLYAKAGISHVTEGLSLCHIIR